MSNDPKTPLLCVGGPLHGRCVHQPGQTLIAPVRRRSIAGYATLDYALPRPEDVPERVYYKRLKDKYGVEHWVAEGYDG